jgi:hypothetical protein
MRLALSFLCLIVCTNVVHHVASAASARNLYLVFSEALVEEIRFEVRSALANEDEMIERLCTSMAEHRPGSALVFHFNGPYTVGKSMTAQIVMRVLMKHGWRFPGEGAWLPQWLDDAVFHVRAFFNVPVKPSGSIEDLSRMFDASDLDLGARVSFWANFTSALSLWSRTAKVKRAGPPCFSCVAFLISHSLCDYPDVKNHPHSGWVLSG